MLVGLLALFVTSQTPPNCPLATLAWCCLRCSAHLLSGHGRSDRPRDCSPRGLNLMPKIIDHDARRRQVFEGSPTCSPTTGTQGWGCDSSPARSVCRQDRCTTTSRTSPHRSRGCFDTRRPNMSSGHQRHGPHRGPKIRLSVVREFIVAQADRIRAVLWVAIDYRRAMGDAGQPLVAEVFGVYESGIAEHLTGGDRDKARQVLSFVMGVLVHSGLSEQPMDIGPMLQAMDRLAL